MKFIDKQIGKQIRKPSGFLGSILGYIMAADHKDLTEWTLDQLKIKNKNYILDIGCGSGLAIKMIRNIVDRDSYIVGIDYSSLMLKQTAKRNKQAKKNGKIGLCHSDVSTLPFADASFDRVCAIETFYFWKEPSNSLGEVRRVLKSGGSAAFAMEISKEGIEQASIIDNAKRLGFPVYSGDEMKTLLLNAGFVNVRCHKIPEREKGWLCAVGDIPH